MSNIILTQETATRHKFLKCVEPGAHWYIAITKVNPDYCLAMHLGTFQEQNYTYVDLGDAYFEAAPKWEVRDHMKKHLEKLNENVTSALLKRDSYIKLMSDAFLDTLLA